MAPAVEQAWALPVNISTLGAHLTAYIATRSAIDALRLCNRFGSSDKGITTLPLELVEHVEQYLLEDIRAQERKMWTADQRCCEGLCVELDHFDDDMIHETYHDMQEGGDLEWSAEDRLCVAQTYHDQDSETDGRHFNKGTCAICRVFEGNEPHSKQDVTNQRVRVADRLWQLEDENILVNPSWDLLRGYGPHWYGKCRDSQLRWEGRIGHDAGESLGLLGKMSKLLQEDFGLGVRVIHGPWRADQYRQKDSCHRPTSAYLELPSEKSAQGRCDLTTPTPARLARFGRAIRTLGLEVVVETAAMDVSENNGWNMEGHNIANTTDIVSKEPRAATFSQYADDVEGDPVWEAGFWIDEDVYEMPVGAVRWKWAVVKP